LNKRLKRQLGRIGLRRENKSKEKLKKDHQPLLPFTLKFIKKKTTWPKSNHHSPKEHLEIMLCNKG